MIDKNVSRWMNQRRAIQKKL